MRIVFAGTPSFAAVALEALLGAGAGGWQVTLVLTQPDRPAGRGLKRTASAVAERAALADIPIATPATLNPRKDAAGAAAALDRIAAAAPDLLVVAAYGLILPPSVLDLPHGLPCAAPGDTTPLKALNIHASLLPRWRGAAPIARALEAGDAQTGVTLMKMDAGLDTGPMLAHRSTAIGADETTGTLTQRLAAIGAELLVEQLRAHRATPWQAAPQPAAGVTYAHKLDKHDAWLDWTRAACALVRQVRAFDPFPVACAQWPAPAPPGVDAAAPLRVWRARAEASIDVAPAARPAPGTVLAATGDGLRVACGDGDLVIEELQRAGGRRLPVREFLAGQRVVAGMRFSLHGSAAAPA